MDSLQISKLFKEKGLKATPQRIAVYKFLDENRIHPDVETVYKKVLKDNPSFSKTTVYNCLQALEKSGLIMAINIDCDKIRYDANYHPHAHFKCECCGEIYDLDEYETPDEINGFDVKTLSVYYSGICSHCKNIKNN